jgi:hypothetical protein
MEETVEEVGNAQIAKLLALIRGVVILDSESTGNS